MAIFDQPLEARLRAYESANRYDRPRDALHLVLICCRGPMGANSILTLELISDLQLAQDLPNGEGSSAVIHPSATTSVRNSVPFLSVCCSKGQHLGTHMGSPSRVSGNCHRPRDPLSHGVQPV